MSTPHVTSAQQTQALTLSTIAFTICFAVWTIFSIIGVQIQAELGLTETQFGLLIGTPILTGSLTRLALGIWTDQYGGRTVLSLVMITSAIAIWAVLKFPITEQRAYEVRTELERRRGRPDLADPEAARA